MKAAIPGAFNGFRLEIPQAELELHILDRIGAVLDQMPPETEFEHSIALENFVDIVGEMRQVVARASNEVKFELLEALNAAYAHLSGEFDMGTADLVLQELTAELNRTEVSHA